MNHEAVDLPVIGMHQDGATGATGEINRVGAGEQYRRRTHVVAGAGVWDDLQGNDRITHCDLTGNRREHNGLSAIGA
jgi:hypothetical protein